MNVSLLTSSQSLNLLAFFANGLCAISLHWNVHATEFSPLELLRTTFRISHWNCLCKGEKIVAEL